jgi:hypothetical protein
MSIPSILKSVIRKLPVQRFSQGHAYASLNRNKLDLIDFAFTSLKLSSFADLGGVWGVDGGYTFYALEKYNLTKAVMVDTHPTENTIERSKECSQLRFIRGNFGDQRIAQEIGPVDAIFLFDILLHQVAPDWDKILEMYAPQTRCLVIYNPQWIGSSLTVRLLDLGEEEYFRNVPHGSQEKPYDMLFQKLDQPHPHHHGRTWKDVHHIWQWGVTDEDLQAKTKSLGFRLQYSMKCGRFGDLTNFENRAYVFSK